MKLRPVVLAVGVLVLPALAGCGGGETEKPEPKGAAHWEQVRAQEMDRIGTGEDGLTNPEESKRSLADARVLVLSLVDEGGDSAAIKSAGARVGVAFVDTALSYKFVTPDGVKGGLQPYVTDLPKGACEAAVVAAMERWDEASFDLLEKDYLNADMKYETTMNLADASKGCR